MRRLQPELKEKILEEIDEGVRKGLGYHRIWRMLRDGGVEVSKSTVRNYYYRKYPERVKKRGPYLDRTTRIKLFDEVRRLRRRGYSYSKIIRRIERAYGVRLSKTHVSDWSRGIHNPSRGCRTPTIESLQPTPELAYVIGVVCGDGYVFRIHRKQWMGDEWVIGLIAKDEEFVRRFSQSLGRVLGREPPRPRRRNEGLLVVKAYSKTLYLLLRKPIIIERVRPFVEHCRECMVSFLKGFFDSEGGVSRYGHIACYNTDKTLLRYVKKLLNSLGIEATGPHLSVEKGTLINYRRMDKMYRTKKDAYHLYVRTQSYLKFYRLIGFTIKRKQLRLENYLKRRGLLERPTNQTSPNLSSIIFFTHTPFPLLARGLLGRGEPSLSALDSPSNSIIIAGSVESMR